MNDTGLINRLRRAYGTLITGASVCQPVFLLAVRLYWGWLFFLAGKAKLMEHASFVETFRDRFHVPFPDASVWLAGSAECFGGLLLLAGLWSRAAAIPLIFTMAVAYMTADRKAVLGILDDPNAFVSAPPFLFLMAATIVLIWGPGALSLDALLGRYFGGPTYSLK